MSTPTIAGTDRGLGVLDTEQMRLVRALDGLLLDHAEDGGAADGRWPFLLDPADLDGIDYFENFPHLGLAATGLDATALAGHLAAGHRPLDAVPADALRDARHVLPSAACYAIFADQRGSAVPAGGRRHTTVATCFRNETHYDGLRRLLGYTVREITTVGDAGTARENVVGSTAFVERLCADLGLALRVEKATDPFFDPRGSRATMQALFPVKQEFVVDDLALGSVNYHRNFFGERCDIRLADGTPAHTSCIGFGLERWVDVLTRVHGSARAATAAVTTLAAEYRSRS